MSKTMYKVSYCLKKVTEKAKDSGFDWIILDNLDNLTDLFDCMNRDGYQMNVYSIDRVEDDEQ